jgi:hypothetical protein
LKYSTEGLLNDDSDLFNIVFSEPGYMYDIQLENIINGLRIPPNKIIEGILNQNLMEKKESVTTKTDKLTYKAVPTPTFLNKE